MKRTRRDFLVQSALASGVTVPLLWSKNSLAMPASRPKLAAIGVGGSHGMWKQGTGDSLWASEYGDLVAVCDADRLHCDEFNNVLNEKWKDKKETNLVKFTDYRKMLDEVKPEAVIIATPDHWHVPISIAALNAGCDVYCEKPLTLTMEEGTLIRQAVKRTGKVFQVGTQQRSQWDMRFLQAVAMVRLGYLGEVKKVHIAIESGPNNRAFDLETPPDSLDWNMWVGPAQKADYSSHRQKEFRWFYDYSGGKITDWGAHHIDIAQWAMGKENTGPIRVSGGCGFPAIVPDKFNFHAYLNGDLSLPNGNMTPVNFKLTMTYADGLEITVNDRYVDEASDTRMQNGILFEGSKGRLMVNRNRTTGQVYEQLSESDYDKLKAEMVKLYKGKTPEQNHMKNFFQCIEDRTTPVSDVETHVRTMECCHLCNIALMLGRDVQWDPDKRTFIGDDQAVAFMSRPRRKGFELPS
jgi:myo-inositol 2-dehydrogenase / D-chiro-inositol 1-dehydrogenase